MRAWLEFTQEFLSFALYTSDMRYSLLVLTIAVGLAGDKKVKMKDLPAPVRQAVETLSKSSTIVGLAKEVEDGKTMYEAETKVNGKTRDVTIDEQGKIVMTEDEVAIDSIPVAARAAIEKEAAGGGKITLVEKVTKGSDVKYEAAITPKSGKKKEVSFSAEGVAVKW